MQVDVSAAQCLVFEMSGNAAISLVIISRCLGFDNSKSEFNAGLPEQCSHRGTEEGLNYPDQAANESAWRYFTEETQSEEYINGLINAPIGQHKYVTTGREHLTDCADVLIRVLKQVQMVSTPCP